MESQVHGALVEIRRPQLEAFHRERPDAGGRLLFALLADVALRFRATDQKLADTVMWGSILGPDDGL